MRDLYGRNIDYMRISITDRCNLRCKYCMPDGIEWVSMAEILSMEEICRITRHAAGLGIRHIKITGGEPLVRRGCCDLIRMIKAIPGIEKVTITTNGMLLGQYLDELVDAGIDGINISLDTTDPVMFEKITGTDGLQKVMESIERASRLSIPVKVNAVSLRIDEIFGNSQENVSVKHVDAPGKSADPPSWQSLVELARKYPVDVRFIEMMPIGHGKEFPAMDHGELLEEIRSIYPGIEPDDRVHGFGPAVYYRIPDFQGSIGFISAIHGKFCSDCNRVRLTSQGYLKTCLCYEDGADLRAILRSGLPETKKNELLTEAIYEAVFHKPAAHCFDRPDAVTEAHNMSAIGG
jgi:cyclic pyranopterin phosphate synthase